MEWTVKHSMNTVIESFETAQCSVFVCDTGLEAFGEKIYACCSVHKCSGIHNIRFGNKTQIDGMVKTYVKKGT